MDIFTFFESIAKRIQNERLKIRLTPERMAKKLGISPESYREIEGIAGLKLNTWRQMLMGLSHWKNFQKIFITLKAIDKGAAISNRGRRKNSRGRRHTSKRPF